MTPPLSRMPGWQAALASRALELASMHNEKRAAWGWRINEALGQLPLIDPQQRDEQDDVFVRLAVRVRSPLQRGAIVRDLRARGIDASGWYSHAAHAYPWWPFDVPQPGVFPQAEALASQLIVVPVHYAMNDERVECIVSTFARHANASPGRPSHSLCDDAPSCRNGAQSSHHDSPKALVRGPARRK